MRTVTELRAEIARLEAMAKQVESRTTLKAKDWQGEKWISGSVGRSRVFFRACDLSAMQKAMAEFKLPSE
jgi:hypothetical protein